MDKCPGCGSLNDSFTSSCYKCKAPLGGVKTQTAQKEVCKACRRPLPGYGTLARKCMHCGWDSARNMRRCMSCDGPVVFNEASIGESKNGGAETGFMIGGVVLAVCARAAGQKLGYALGLTGMGVVFGLVIGTATLYRAVFTHYQCTMCRNDADPALLTTAERQSLAGFRMRYSLLTAAMGAVAAACLLARMANLGV